MTAMRWQRVRTVLVALIATAVIAAAAPPGSTAPATSPGAAPPALVAVPADVVPPAARLASACPTGLVRGPTYRLEDFNGGGVYDPENGGFFLRLPLEDGFVAVGHELGTVPVGTVGSVVLGFRAKGVTTGSAQLLVRAGRPYIWTQVPITPTWAPFHLDVTGFVTGTPRKVTLSLEHSYDIEVGGQGPSTVDVDDVEIYGCVAPPATGVRGDWLSNGRTGLVAVSNDTRLYSFAGTGRGTFLAPRLSGTRWDFVAQLASPGDPTGDRRTDLLAVSGSKLYLYPGRGAGTLGSRIQVGDGWAGDELATPGDTTGDGRPDLWSIRANGKLHLYRFTGPTTLRYVKQIGTGWASQKLVGIGDLNGDRRPDGLGVLSDGCIRFYPGTATAGLGTSRTLSCGWRVMNWVGSPGDVTGDGLADLLARNYSGVMWLYRGLPGGGLSKATPVGIGWSSWRLIA